MSYQSGKLSGFVKPGTKEPGDLLDKGLGREESIVLLSELLDQLLLLVELFEVIGTHEGNSLGLGLIAVLLVAEHAHGELRTRHVSQLHSAGESLVLLGIVVLEADLQVDGLHELAFFGLLGMLEHLGHALKEGFFRYFTHVGDMTSARTTI